MILDPGADFRRSMTREMELRPVLSYIIPSAYSVKKSISGNVY